MAKKPTIKEQVKKEIARIRKGIRAAARRGIVVQENYIPKMPKKPTSKTLERLQKTKPSDITKKHGLVINPDTGVILTYKQWDVTRRQQAAKKQSATIKRKKLDLKFAKEHETTYDTTMMLRQRLEDMERPYWSQRVKDIQSIKAMALETFDDNMLNDEEAYTAYLTKPDVQRDIAYNLGKFEQEYEETSARMYATTLISLLNMGALSQLQRDALGDLADMYDMIME